MQQSTWIASLANATSACSQAYGLMALQSWPQQEDWFTFCMVRNTIACSHSCRELFKACNKAAYLLITDVASFLCQLMIEEICRCASLQKGSLHLPASRMRPRTGAGTAGFSADWGMARVCSPRAVHCSNRPALFGRLAPHQVSPSIVISAGIFGSSFREVNGIRGRGRAVAHPTVNGLLFAIYALWQS